MDFDKITIDAVSYNVKDSTARKQISDETSARKQEDAQLSQKISNETTELNSRISTIIADGQQTEGNTELIDIRTGADGKVYPTAGDAVRGQIGALSEENAELKGDLVNVETALAFVKQEDFENGRYVNVNGAISNNDLTKATSLLPLNAKNIYVSGFVSTSYTNQAYVCFYSRNEVISKFQVFHCMILKAEKLLSQKKQHMLRFVRQ